jgi:uncharacterized protein (DUF2236 family)
VSGVSEAWRSRLLELFSGTADGRPAWVTAIEDGDDGGYFGPGSAAWAVHGGMPTLVAGIRALLMQTLHPGAMAGVHDWSRYREDPLGRLTGTIRWLITVTFADTATAIEQSERVKGYHGRVTGNYLDARGEERPYSAADPELLSWVHIVFTDAFLATHRIWGGPIPGGPDQYVREWARAGELMAVPTPPRSEGELRAQISAFRDAGILKSDERVAETVRFIQNPPLRREMLPGYRILFAGAVASLEPEYREMLGLKLPALGPIPLPAVAATRVTLSAVGAALGTRSPSEEAARRRIARVAAARSDVPE